MNPGKLEELNVLLQGVYWETRRPTPGVLLKRAYSTYYEKIIIIKIYNRIILSHSRNSQKLVSVNISLFIRDAG